MSTILIPCSGTRGDVEPYAVLGAELARLGHRVLLAAHPEDLDIAREQGHETLTLGENPSIALAILSRELGGSRGPSRASAVRRYLRRARAAYRDLADTLLDSMESADCVLLSLPTFWLYPVARALGKTVVMAPLQPLTPSSAYPTVLVPGLRRAPPVLRRAGHAVALTGVSLPWWGTLRRWGARRCPAARFGPGGPMARMLREGVPFVYGISPSLFGRPADWPANHGLYGAWLTTRDEMSSVAGARVLRAFLEAPGPPVVFVSFGSLARPSRSLLQGLSTAAARAECRLLVQATAPWATDTDRVRYLEGPLPHDWILARVAGAIHHGGAGTVHRVARAGIPQLALPSGADGWFWAARLEALGVSPAGVDPGPGVHGLERALRELSRSVSLHSSAAALGERVRRERGAREAAAVISAVVAATIRESRST